MYIISFFIYFSRPKQSKPFKMKKILSTFSLLIVIIFTSNAQIKQAGIISVYGNRNLSDNPLETKLYEALLNDTSFRITNTVNEFEQTLFDEVVPKFPFSFVEKEVITGNKKYQELDERLLNASAKDQDDTSNWVDFSPYVTAPGYKAISGFGLGKDAKLINQVFELFPDLDAIMIGYIDFNLVTEAGAMGISSEKVYAYCHIAVYDRQGKKLMRLRESAKSDSGVMGVSGMVTDPDKLKPMIESASKNLLIDLRSGKINKKIEKMIRKKLK